MQNIVAVPLTSFFLTRNSSFPHLFTKMLCLGFKFILATPLFRLHLKKLFLLGFMLRNTCLNLFTHT